MLYSLYNLRKHSQYEPSVKVRTKARASLPHEEHRKKIRAKFEKEKAKRALGVPAPVKYRVRKPPKFLPNAGKRSSTAILRQMKSDLDMDERNPQLYRPTPSRDIQISELQDALSGEKSRKKADKENRLSANHNHSSCRRSSERHSKKMSSPLQIQFDEVSEEIKERREFLAKMTALGEGDAYEANIRNEIAQRTRDLKKLDEKMRRATRT